MFGSSSGRIVLLDVEYFPKVVRLAALPNNLIMLVCTLEIDQLFDILLTTIQEFVFPELRDATAQPNKQRFATLNNVGGSRV